MALPAPLIVTPSQPQEFINDKWTDEERKSSARVLALLEAILEEQAGLRGGVRRLEEGLCTKLDDLSRSVEACSTSEPARNHPIFRTLDQMGDDVALAFKQLEMEAKKWFMHIDTDKSGSLSRDELSAMLKSWSMSESRRSLAGGCAKMSDSSSNSFKD